MPSKAEANRRTWQIPEVRAARSQNSARARRGRDLSWEHRINIAAGMKALWRRRRAEQGAQP